MFSLAYDGSGDPVSGGEDLRSHIGKKDKDIYIIKPTTTHLLIDQWIHLHLPRLNGKHNR